MHANLQQPAPLVCVIAAVATSERKAHFALAGELLNDLADKREPLLNGYAFRFSADLLERVARFVINERKCCPFLSFEITMAAEAGAMWLRMTGPAGASEVLEAELNLNHWCSNGCGASNG